MATNTKIVKKANRYIVMNAIRKSASITIEGIIQETGLSRPTVLNILKKFLDEEIVIPSGFAPSDGGRQPMLYALNPHRYFAIGIDVDGPPINLVVADLNGEVVYSKTWNINFGDEGAFITQSIIAEIDTAIQALHIEYKKVLGIALGMPATVDMEANTTVRLSRLYKWNNYPISDNINQHTGIKVYLRNDTHLISIAEHRMISNVDDSLFIVHRSGIGMSAIINNQLYEGAMGNPGYIGHTTLFIEGRDCDCGQKGCFEVYCSKRAITKDYAEAAGMQKSYPEILELAAKGDSTAIAIFEKAGELFGVGISNFVKTFEIYTVILGDVICDEDHIFFKSIVQSARKHLENYTNKPLLILKGKLTGENFGLGGCHFILSKYFASPKLRLD